MLIIPLGWSQHRILLPFLAVVVAGGENIYIFRKKYIDTDLVLKLNDISTRSKKTVAVPRTTKSSQSFLDV